MSRPGAVRNYSSGPAFSDKQKLLISKTHYPASFKEKVEWKKVQLSVFKPWITQKITELLGFEDDIVINYAFEMLETAQGQESLDPREFQHNLTGFLESKAAEFAASLWLLLLSASKEVSGIPKQFLEEELQRMKEEKERERVKEKERERIWREQDRMGDSDRYYYHDDRDRRRSRYRSDNMGSSRHHPYRERERERGYADDGRRDDRERRGVDTNGPVQRRRNEWRSEEHRHRSHSPMPHKNEKEREER
jgi:serine/arginine repetitive matrix protein 1